jgi:uncharacterized protein (TIGR03437 family)
MSSARLLAAALVLLPCLWPQGPGNAPAPYYSAESIVNSANNQPGYLAPNTLATVYGTGLAWSTGIAPVSGGLYPTSFASARVSVGGIYASLIYVSPQQVNFLIPYQLVAGNVDVFVERDNLRGPKVRLMLNETAPAPFQLDQDTLIATRVDGSLITRDAPARPGEIAVLWVTGLGHSQPPQESGRVAREPAQMEKRPVLRLLAQGEAVADDRILYAGVTPGYAGLYQINLRLPENAAGDLEVRIQVGPDSMPFALLLPLEP